MTQDYRFLSNIKLLSILLGKDQGRKSHVAERIWQQHQSWQKIYQSSLPQWRAQALDPLDFSCLWAAREINRRYLRETLQRNRLHNPTLIRSYLRDLFKNYLSEHFCVLLLDAQLQLIDTLDISQNDNRRVSLNMRLIVGHCLQHGAHFVFLAHNHPSGDERASQADIDCTHKLQDALGLVDIEILDHFIVTPNNIISLRERKLLR